MGFSQIKRVSLKKLTLSADNVGFFFPEKPGLSKRNPHYLRAQIMWVYLKRSLSARANNMGFFNLIFNSSDVLMQSWERGCSFV